MAVKMEIFTVKIKTGRGGAEAAIEIAQFTSELLGQEDSSIPFSDHDDEEE